MNVTLKQMRLSKIALKLGVNCESKLNNQLVSKLVRNFRCRAELSDNLPASALLINPK